jgi:hypothetical protein
MTNLEFRLDWARSRSRAHRWTEEIKLLVEEMRWVALSFMNASETWLARAGTSEQFPEDISRGLDAYAFRQANVWSSLAISCIRSWSPFLEQNGLEITWPDSLAHYKTVSVMVSANNKFSLNFLLK